MRFLKPISNSNHTDEELVHLYKSTENLAVLGSLYERYMELVYGVCLKYLEDSENAKDSTILIFEELIAKLQKHEVQHFKNWLYQLAKNHCLMRLRTEKRNRKVTIDPDLMQFEENVHLNGVLEQEDHFEQLQYCLAQLVEEQRKTIELFYLEEKSYQEIVTITGLEWNKVRSYIQNGRRNLKNCMDQQKMKHATE